MHDFTLIGALAIIAFSGLIMYKRDIFPLTNNDKSVMWIVILVLIVVWGVLSENILKTGDADLLKANITTQHCHALYKRASSGDSLHIAKKNVYCLSVLTDKTLRWNR